MSHIISGTAPSTNQSEGKGSAKFCFLLFLCPFLSVMKSLGVGEPIGDSVVIVVIIKANKW